MSAIPNGYPESANDAFALLMSRDRLSIDDLKVLAMIEQSGQAFYMAIARAAAVNVTTCRRSVSDW